MQVVYSGGSTPNPSPRLQRKTGYGRPIMPGYMTHVHPQILVQRSCEKLTEGDMTLRDSIPAMSKCVASLCLLFNIVLPGSGTLMAGLSVLCCSHVRPKGDSKAHCIWVNAGVALVQFLLTFLFLLGWIWSIMWGVAFLSVSRQYYYRQQDDNNRQKHNGVEIVHCKMKNMPNPDLEAKDASSNSKKKNHNHDYDNQHQTERHSHHLQHQQKHYHASKISSSESQCSDADQNIPSTSKDIHGKDSNNHITTPIPNGYSQPNNTYEVEPRQPIIVLQQAPLGSQFDTSVLASRAAPGETIMKARTRHMKILQRKMSDNDLSPFRLTHTQLEAIVIHDLPVRAPDRRHMVEDDNPRDALPKC